METQEKEVDWKEVGLTDVSLLISDAVERFLVDTISKYYGRPIGEWCMSDIQIALMDDSVGDILINFARNWKHVKRYVNDVYEPDRIFTSRDIHK